MWHPSTCTHGVAGVGDVLGGGAVVERKTGLGDHFPRIRANNVSLQVQRLRSEEVAEELWKRLAFVEKRLGGGGWRSGGGGGGTST